MSKPLREKDSQTEAKFSGRTGSKHLADDDAINRFTILNLFGKERLETIQATIAKATGLALVTLDYKGDIITEMTDFTPFCKEMRHKERSAHLCRSSDVYGAGQALARQRKFIYFCPCGLLEVAIPIIVKNHYLGGFYGGQVRCENAPQDIPRLAKLFEGELKGCAFTERQKKLYASIPVYDYTSFGYITELISMIINQIGEREMVTQGLAKATNSDLELVRGQVKRLETELSHARHEAVNLTARLDYYFLINTLNAISNLAEIENSPRTNEMIQLFAAHLQAAAPRVKNFVLLAEEIEDAKRYLEMQKVRFGDLLRYTITVPKDLSARRVPVHILTPFVESAVFYGLNTRDDGLNITIAAGIEENALAVTVADDGPGLTEDELHARFASYKNGYGGDAMRMNLISTRRRLAALFDSDDVVTITAVPGKGTRCVIRIPLQAPVGEA